MPICGPKLSVCGIVLSAWGIVQLALMGLFYQLRTVALVDDLPGIEHATAHDFDDIVNAGYTQNALNCWIGAGLYVLTLIISAQQFYANTRTSVNL